MKIITITSQADLDALPDKFEEYTRIEIRASVKIRVNKARENSSVVACPGIYQSTLSSGTLVKAVRVIAFVRPPVYRKRFMFWETAEKVANERWKPLFDEAMEAALDRAR